MQLTTEIKEKLREAVQGPGYGQAKAQKAVQRIQARQHRAAALYSQFDRVAILDSSGSMMAGDAHDLTGLPCSRWDALQGALSQVLPLAKNRLAAYVFSDVVEPVRGSATGQSQPLQFLGGGTSMCQALREAGHHNHPDLRILLVSDGQPTDGDPIPVAMAIGRPIDTVYVGPASGEGKELLKELSRLTGGLFLDMAGKFDAARFLEHCKTVLQLDQGGA